MSNTIRDIIGMCHLIDGLDFISEDVGSNGAVFKFGKEIFYGNIQQCFNYVSLYKRMAKHKQVAELLEKICRGNIEEINKAENWNDLLDATINMTKDLKEVYLSDEEVNDKATKEKQG